MVFALIIVVNKFDTYDSDLNGIYDKISTRIGLPNNRIFKYSSHCQLVDAIKTQQLDFFVPKFARKEINNILKNSNIIIRKDLIKNDRIQYTALEYQQELETDESEEEIEGNTISEDFTQEHDVVPKKKIMINTITGYYKFVTEVMIEVYKAVDLELKRVYPSKDYSFLLSRVVIAICAQMWKIKQKTEMETNVLIEWAMACCDVADFIAEEKDSPRYISKKKLSLAELFEKAMKADDPSDIIEAKKITDAKEEEEADDINEYVEGDEEEEEEPTLVKKSSIKSKVVEEEENPKKN
jgi:hypothetical protein